MVAGKLKSTASLGLAITLIACFANTSIDDGATVVVESPPQPGELTVTYTIDRVAAPALCERNGASAIELVVYDGYGSASANAFAPCSDFAVHVELPEGNYAADATLVNSANEPISITIPLYELRVISGAELTIAIDFPRHAML